MSAGGIFGRVIALDSDAVEVEVAPGVVMTFLPKAISLRPGTTGGGSTAATPVDDPWPVESGGPGDTAGGPVDSAGGPGDSTGAPGDRSGGPGDTAGPTGA